ncbi:hypothetical protein P4V47_08720 [Brevibacillus laterosporus]|uniref:hypothetical protein n=1 Tax=Brevibacillus laterosporus TaxID=1465 RepID=UPI002E1CA721|nr:hypothetical protein [Brevibacillus laterosporus]
MNIQAVERMEGLIKKARDIAEKIEALKEWIDVVKGVSFKTIIIKSHYRGFSTSKWGSEYRPNKYNSEVEAYMINAFIDITKAEIARLERELAELWVWD